MATLDELLVEIGIGTDDLTHGAASAADDVERSLAGIGDAADAAARDISQAADQASGALDGVGDSADQAAQGAEEAAANVEGSFNGIAAAAAGAAVGGLFAAGLTSAMDASAANSKLAIQLGLTGPEAERAGKIAGEIFSKGFGESIDAVNESIGSVASSMGGMGKLSDDELKLMATSALTVADILGTDVSDAATAAGQMLKQGLVKDGQEGFDVLTRAAKAFPKSMIADIPAVIADYGQHFEMLGLDAQTAFGLMSQYVQAGGKDIDQAGDILHEFARITAEESGEASKAFDAIGLSGKDMLAKIHAGGPEATAALGETIKALKGMKDPAKQSEMALALFGDMAGEAGDALWAMDPATAAAATGMDNVKGAAQEANEAVGASKSMETIWRQISTTLGEFLAPALQKISEFISEHPALIKVLVPVLLGLAVAIGIAVIAQWAWNTALWAFPGTWIIAGIIALIAVIVLIIVYWDEIAAATGKAWDWITSKLSAAWDLIMLGVVAVWDWVSRIVTDAMTWIAEKVTAGIDRVTDTFDWLSDLPGRVASWFGDVVDWVAGLPGRISRAASGMWDGIKNSFKDTINSLIWLWNNLSFTIGGGSFMGMDIPELTLHTPDIPYLADGGVTTGPTLAMIGEGAEQEAVLPLSKLDGMLRSVAGNVGQVGREPAVLVIRGDGSAASQFIVESLRLSTRTSAGGSVVQLIEER